MPKLSEPQRRFALRIQHFSENSYSIPKYAEFLMTQPRKYFYALYAFENKEDGLFVLGHLLEDFIERQSAFVNERKKFFGDFITVRKRGA